MKKNLALINKDLKAAGKKREKEYKEHIVEVTRLITEVFGLAIPYDSTDEIVSKAVVRYARDYPPKKEDKNKEKEKFGDEIIWETLKHNIKGEDLTIITHDPDFSEPGKPDQLNKVLKDEWKTHTGKKLTLQKYFSGYMNTIEGKDKISLKTIEKETKEVKEETSTYGLLYTPGVIDLSTGLANGVHIQSSGILGATGVFPGNRFTITGTTGHLGISDVQSTFSAALLCQNCHKNPVSPTSILLYCDECRKKFMGGGLWTEGNS